MLESGTPAASIKSRALAPVKFLPLIVTLVLDPLASWPGDMAVMSGPLVTATLGLMAGAVGDPRETATPVLSTGTVADAFEMDTPALSAGSEGEPFEIDTPALSAGAVGEAFDMDTAALSAGIEGERFEMDTPALRMGIIGEAFKIDTPRPTLVDWVPPKWTETAADWVTRTNSGLRILTWASPNTVGSATLVARTANVVVG
jgi:hypothetical protein